MSFLPIPKRARKRLLHHLWLGLASFVATILLYTVLLPFYPEPERWTFRWSLATSYVATVLLAGTLTLGAWNVLRERVNPVSSDLRRDTGIWCGVFSFLHIAFGLNVHLKSWMLYFVTEAGRPRADLFGFTNYLGVLATLVVVVLLATSNDFSLRRFGRERWKAIQRWSYVFAFLIIAHGIVYQFVENRFMPFLFILGLIVLWMAATQFAGFNKRRREVENSLRSATEKR